MSLNLVVCMGHRGRKTRAKDETRIMRIETAFLFDLDGTLVDSVHHDTRYLYLIDRKTAEDVTFVTDSDGGRRAVGDLSNQIALVRVAHPGAAPIVELVAGPWPTRYGMKSSAEAARYHAIRWGFSGRSSENDGKRAGGLGARASRQALSRTRMRPQRPGAIALAQAARAQALSTTPRGDGVARPRQATRSVTKKRRHGHGRPPAEPVGELDAGNRHVQFDVTRSRPPKKMGDET